MSISHSPAQGLVLEFFPFFFSQDGGKRVTHKRQKESRSLIIPSKEQDSRHRTVYTVLFSSLQQCAGDEYVASGGQRSRSISFLQGCSSFMKENKIKRKNQCHLFKLSCTFKSKGKSQDKRVGGGSVNPLLVTPATLMKAFQRIVGLFFSFSSCPAGSRSLKDAGWDQTKNSCRSSWGLTEPRQPCHELSYIACPIWNTLGNKMDALRAQPSCTTTNTFDWHIAEIHDAALGFVYGSGKKAAINRLQPRTVCPSTILGLAICKLHCNSLCCSAAKTKALWFSSHSSGYNKEVVCAESCPSFMSLRIHCPALAHPRHHLPRECLKIFSHSLKLQFSVCISSKGKRFMETIVFPVPQT